MSIDDLARQLFAATPEPTAEQRAGVRDRFETRRRSALQHRKRWFNRRGPLIAFAGAVLSAGVAIGGLALRPEAPPEIQRAVIEGLSLPAPDRDRLLPLPGGQRLEVEGHNDLGTWSLYSVETRGGLTLVTTGFQPQGARSARPEGGIGGCPESVLTEGRAIAPCGMGGFFLLSPSDPKFDPGDRSQQRLVVVGRTAPDVDRIEFVRGDGSIITGWAANTFYLLVLPAQPDILKSARIVPYAAADTPLPTDDLTSDFWTGSSPVLPSDRSDILRG